jgi:hypothetical protein
MYSASSATYVSRLCTTLPHVIAGQQVPSLKEIFKSDKQQAERNAKNFF